MITPRILASGRFSPEDLEVSVGPSNRQISPEIENKIEATWEKVLEDAKAKGKTCYNGLSYRLNSLQEENGKLVLNFGTLEFRVRNGIRKTPGYFDLPEEFFVKGCYTDATVKTSDGWYLLIELSGKSMNENDIDFIGGIMETNFGMKTGQDIFDSFYTELKEEGRINSEDIQEVYLQSVLLSHSTNIAFHFEVVLNVTLEDVLKRENEDAEVASLQGFSREEYIKILENHKSPNKRLVAETMRI